MNILTFDTQYSMRNRIAELEQQVKAQQEHINMLEGENAALSLENEELKGRITCKHCD